MFFNPHRRIKAKKTVTGMWGTGCSLVALDVNIEVRNVTCMALDARFPMVDTHSQVRHQSDSVSISKPRFDTLWIGIARCKGIWNMHPSFTTSFYENVKSRDEAKLQCSLTVLLQLQRVPNCPKRPGKMTCSRHYNLFESCKLKVKTSLHKCCFSLENMFGEHVTLHRVKHGLGM